MKTIIQSAFPFIGTLFMVAIIFTAMAFRNPYVEVTKDKSMLPGDTVPKSQLNINIDIQKALAEANKAIASIDFSKIMNDVQVALKKIDAQKIQMEIEQSLKKIDFEKMQKDIDASLKKIDWNMINK